MKKTLKTIIILSFLLILLLSVSFAVAQFAAYVLTDDPYALGAIFLLTFLLSLGAIKLVTK